MNIVLTNTQFMKRVSGNEPSDIMNVNELSTITGYKPATIYIKRSKGEIPKRCYFYLAGGRLLRFRRKETLEWIETGM